MNMEFMEFIENIYKENTIKIVDIFQDDQMPAFLFAPAFFSPLKEILSQKGVILFNTIVKTKAEAQTASAFIIHRVNLLYVNIYI